MQQFAPNFERIAGTNGHHGVRLRGLQFKGPGEHDEPMARRWLRLRMMMMIKSVNANSEAFARGPTARIGTDSSWLRGAHYADGIE